MPTLTAEEVCPAWCSIRAMAGSESMNADQVQAHGMYEVRLRVGDVALEPDMWFTDPNGRDLNITHVTNMDERNREYLCWAKVRA